jgi:MFS family permease
MLRVLKLRHLSIFQEFLRPPELQTAPSPTPNEDGEFDWDEITQGLLLSSFFWGYIVTQIPGGILVRRFGSKWILGLGCLTAAVMSLLTPIAARTSVYALMAVRVVEGLGEVFGLTYRYALGSK